MSSKIEAQMKKNRTSVILTKGSGKDNLSNWASATHLGDTERVQVPCFGLDQPWFMVVSGE